jgi:hypothetical protein
MGTNMPYEHTQHGPLHRIFLAVAALMLVAVWLVQSEPMLAAINLVIAGVFLLTSLMFASLTVRDDGEGLAVRYGPLPIFRRRIRYADITGIEPDRTRLIDGLGIHYVPGRGWTYNLWGFDCVKFTLGERVVRLGTDDVENLVEFLRQKIGAHQPSEA